MFKHYRTSWPALLAIAAALAAVILTLSGFELQSILTQAGPALLLANAPVMVTEEFKKLVEEQAEAFIEFKKRHTDQVTALEQRLDEIQLKDARPFGKGGTTPAPSAQTWIDTKTQREVKVYAGADPITTPAEAKDTPSIGRVLRGLVLGGKAHDAKALEDERKALAISSDPAGGYTVSGALSNVWIDRLRAAMVLSRAGAQTVPMDSGELTLAKLTGDPTVSWHAENAALTASDATFGAVTLRAKTCVCLVKMSLELSQDSANIETMLERSIISSMAQAIDSAGLVGVTTDAGAAPATGAGVFGISGRNTVTSVGAPTSWDFAVDGMYELMADNVPSESIGAMVGHPALWKKMRKLKTGLSGDNTPLMAPEEVARLPKLWTTAAPTDKAVIADWRDLLFGVRKGITVQVLTQTYMGSNLQIAIVAYARVDFAAARAASFCTMEGITT